MISESSFMEMQSKMDNIITTLTEIKEGTVQKVYNTNPSADTLTVGWVCTKSGDAGSAVFTSF